MFFCFFKWNLTSSLMKFELLLATSYIQRWDFFLKRLDKHFTKQSVHNCSIQNRNFLAKYWDSRHWCWLAAAHFPLLSPPNYLSALPTGGTQNKPNDPMYPNIQRQKIQIFKCSNIHIFNYNADTGSSLAETYSYGHREACLPA